MLAQDTPPGAAQCLSPLEMPNLPVVSTHSLESKLISHSDLLYLNKSHVPATTQTAKIIFTAVICVSAFLYPSKAL